MATTSRGWRKIADSENDKAQGVNDALEDIDADVAALAARIGNGATGGGATPPSATATINVPANTSSWIPTGISITANSATVLRATGLASTFATGDLYGPGADSRCLLTWLVKAGSAPPASADAAQREYRGARDADDSVTGQIYLRIDSSQYQDNRGSFDVTLTQWNNANNISAMLNVNRARLDVLRDMGVKDEKAARVAADVGLQSSIDEIRARLAAGGL